MSIGAAPLLSRGKPKVVVQQITAVALELLSAACIYTVNGVCLHTIREKGSSEPEAVAHTAFQKFAGSLEKYRVNVRCWKGFGNLNL